MTDATEEVFNEAGEVLKPSNQWLDGLNIIVLDPDGWDRPNLTESWMELITEAEFNRRLMYSTIMTLPPASTEATPEPQDGDETVYPDVEPVPVVEPPQEDPEPVPDPDPITYNPGMEVPAENDETPKANLE